MFFHMSHGSFIGMMPSVKRVSPCGVCMMGCFFVLSALMVLSCFTMVTRGMRVVLCRLLMVLGCFLGHSGVSSVVARWYSHGKQRNAHISENVPL
jgi:hypothetical protein